MTRKDEKRIIEVPLSEIGYKELKNRRLLRARIGPVNLVVIKKPTWKERKGINPFTKEPTIFKANQLERSLGLGR